MLQNIQIGSLNKRKNKKTNWPHNVAYKDAIIEMS